MWIIVDENKVIKSPRAITIDDVQYPKEIFRAWSIEELIAIGIKYFQEESYDSFKYNTSGYTDNDTGDTIVRTYTLVERDEYLDQLKEKQYIQITTDMDTETLEGFTAVIPEDSTSGDVYKMDATEYHINKMQNGVLIAEMNEETTMDLVDYNNDIHLDVAIDDAKEIVRQNGTNFRSLWTKKNTLRVQLDNATTEEQVLAIVW